VAGQGHSGLFADGVLYPSAGQARRRDGIGGEDRHGDRPRADDGVAQLPVDRRRAAVRPDDRAREHQGLRRQVDVGEQEAGRAPREGALHRGLDPARRTATGAGTRPASSVPRWRRAAAPVADTTSAASGFRASSSRRAGSVELVCRRRLITKRGAGPWTIGSAVLRSQRITVIRRCLLTYLAAKLIVAGAPAGHFSSGLAWVSKPQRCQTNQPNGDPP
jgi:hypothetical protein